uniref:Uncharacterized protein n=1 Tax=Arcella intermedia TaxID=1963864 RepID=A0A6B2KWL8_9EUKA
MFEIILEIHDSIKKECDGQQDEFIVSMTKKLLYLDWNTKGKYPMLITLVDRVGVEGFISLKANFLSDLFYAMCNATLRKQVTRLLEAFLKQSIKEHNNSKGGKGLESELYKLWIKQFVSALFSDVSFIGIVSYTLPCILNLFPKSLSFIIQEICSYKLDDSDTFTFVHIRSLLSVLKQARNLGLISADSLETLLPTALPSTSSPLSSLVKSGPSPLYSLLSKVVAHSEEGIKQDSLELICNSRKSTEVPTTFELSIFAAFLSHNMEESSSSFRQVKDVMFQRMIIRLLSAEKKNQRKSAQDIKYYDLFLNWTTSLLLSSIYPSASHFRMVNAIEFLHGLVDVFSSPETVTKKDFNQIINADAIMILFNTMWDYYQVNRNSAFEIMKKLKVPFPGFDNREALHLLVKQTLRRLNSPRLRECEGASLGLSIIFRKYVKESKWIVSIKQNDITIDPNPTKELEAQRSIVLLDSLLSVLKQHIHIATENLEFASVNAPMHGPLMGIRCILSDINFNDNECKINAPQWKELVSSIIETSLLVSETMWSHTHYITYRTTNEGSDMFLDPVQYSMDRISSQSQSVSLCAWMCLKEVSLVLSTLVEKIPLPTEGELAILSAEQIELIGNVLLEILLSVLHAGAIEKTFEGFQNICTHLLKSKNPELHSLPANWLKRLLSSVVDSTKLFKVTTRRSAGFPFAIRAILRSEAVTSTSKKLLNMALTELLSLAESKDGSQDTEERQVHSVNTIRAILRDKNLLEDITIFGEVLFKVALTLYNSNSWAVRNSATMLFSVLVSRGLGWKNYGELGGRIKEKRKGFTLSEFFNKVSGMDQFLLEQLKSSVQLENEQSKVEKHTPLYAILVLFSCLLPSRLVAREQPVTAAFVELIQRLSSNRVWKVREMAAKSLLPLISQEQLEDFIKNTVESIPKSEKLRVEQKISYNQVHGNLLQIYYLLQVHTQSIAYTEQKWFIHIYSSIVPQLQKLFWLLSVPCTVISSSLLSCLAEFVVLDSNLKDLDLSSPQFADFLNLYGNTLKYSLQIVDNSDSELHNFQNRSIAAKMLFHHSLYAFGRLEEMKTGEVVALFTKFVNDVDYEVRLVVMKLLRNFLKNNPTPKKEIDRESIQKELLRRFVAGVETHVDCVSYLLKILYLLQQPLPSSTWDSFYDLEADANIWSKISSLISENQSSSTKESSLKTLGYIIREFLVDTKRRKKLPNLSTVRLMFEQWSQYLQQYSNTDQPFDARNAALASIEQAEIRLDLLKEVTSVEMKKIITKAAIGQWITLITLLQDDDEELRRKAAKLVSTLTKTSQENKIELSLGIAPSLEAAFDYISSNFGNEEYLVDYFIKQLHVSLEDLKLNLKEEMVIFEVEKTNYYFEGVLISQLAANHLKKMMYANNIFVVDRLKLMKDKLFLVVKGLKDFLEELKGWNEKTAVPKALQPTFEEGIFSGLFNLMIGLHTTKQFYTAEELQIIKTNVDLLQGQSIHPILRYLSQTLFNPETSSEGCFIFSPFFLTSDFVAKIKLNN